MLHPISVDFAPRPDPVRLLDAPYTLNLSDRRTPYQQQSSLSAAAGDGKAPLDFLVVPEPLLLSHACGVSRVLVAAIHAIHAVVVRIAVGIRVGPLLRFSER